MSEKKWQQMVGWLFHYVENGLKDMLKIWTSPREPKSPFAFELPWRWWAIYGAAGGLVWVLWPQGKTLPNELWIGVLSFEGLLAALLAAVGPATLSHGAFPFFVNFWSGFDLRLGERLSDSIRQVRDDPAQVASASPFRNAFIVTINTLFLLPLPLVLDSRWTAAILVASLFWTLRRILPDAVGFLLTEYAPVIPAAYWAARSWHEQLSYCPICKGAPQSPAWPPPRPTTEPKQAPQESISHSEIAD